MDRSVQFRAEFCQRRLETDPTKPSQTFQPWGPALADRNPAERGTNALSVARRVRSGPWAPFETAVRGVHGTPAPARARKASLARTSS
jgi:hypothetical protein